ncbi:MAG: tripartite tricarboxylate transporter TctB family protein [Bacteroidota bacterium]|jgi:putative tricarboxylic transport membrane protein
MRRSPAEIALSAGILALGIGVAVGTALLPSEGGYARIGPNFVPGVVGGGLIVVGVWLLYEALAGGWRNRPDDSPAARGEHAFHAPAFLWVTVGLFAHMILIGTAGFVIAGAVLMACVARGFGSRRLGRDLAIGFVLALAAFLFFVKFLNVGLPGGWLAPILGTAGT